MTRIDGAVRLFLFAAASFVAGAISLAEAQSPETNAAIGRQSADSTVVYDQAYFSSLGAVTLEDMIRATPGGIALLNSLRRGDERGFGSAGPPLLIDGRRMTGKSNDISTRLARIPADQVERIELIRGNAEGLDIRSEGVIYNVILRAGADRAKSTFLDVSVNYARGASVAPQMLIAHNGRRGGLQYGASYELTNDPRVNLVREDILSPDRTRLQFRDLFRTDIEKAHTVTGNLGYDFDNGVKLRLNGLYKDSVETDSRTEDQFLVGADGARTFFALEEARFRFADREWELGGDVEADAGFLGNLKALVVLTRRANDNDLTQDLTENDVRERIFSQVADFDEGESIFRASLTKSLGQRHSLEYGGEGAFNTLDTVFAFDDGPLERAIVEEDRYEAFLTHNFKISDALNLQSGVTGEFSTIFQDRDGEENSRSFSFLKPRVELRYDISSADQLRLLAERTVSQLDLNDFVASRNIDDDLINFGNPDLSPESTWRYSLGYEKRFAQDAGAVQIEFFYEDIEDHIDKILIGDDASGVGNIGDARRYGVETEVNARFGFLGLPGAVLTFQYDYQNTRTTDPFTGEARLIRRRTPHYFDVDFRHDIGGSKFTYGFNGHRRTMIRRQDISLREVVRFRRHVEAYGEYNLTPKMKIRFTAHRFLGDARTFEKTFFIGNIADGVVERIDFQDNSIRTEYQLRFQGTW